MIRLLVPLALAGLLAACNTGESFLEWDPETQAMLDQQAAEAEAAAGTTTAAGAEGAEGEAGGEAMAAPAAMPEGATQTPIVIVAADGAPSEGTLLTNASGTRSNQVQVRWASGVSCSGGLVEQAAADATGAGGGGTMALNCDDGTVWIGEYTTSGAGQGAWTLRNGSGTTARALYGADVGADPAAFDALWATRGPGA